MIERTVTPEHLARLKADREAADRRYNEALTALDAALVRPGELPHPPPGADEHQVTPLNEGWDLLRLLPPMPCPAAPTRRCPFRMRTSSTDIRWSGHGRRA